MAQVKWNIDPVHSHIGFSVRHLMISKVRGHFQKWSGALLVDEEDLTKSKVEVSIEAASVDTKEPQRDDHLRSPDFFDAPNHPALTFESTGVARAGEDEYNVTGNLTIRGVSKPVTLATEFLGRNKDPWGGTRMGFSAKTSIDRRDFGLTFNMPLEGGGVVVGDKVEITLEIEAVKEVPAAQTA
jgi:polyisoprenoid-binding protein YceI